MLTLLAFVATTEIILARRGFAPTVHDTQALWLKERERASALGKRALILVGASRIQLDIDLDILRRTTGLEPVQLAIDGSSYVPVLEGLAHDPSIRGTVVLDLIPGPVSLERQSSGASHDFQAEYETSADGKIRWPTYRDIDARMSDAMRNHLINYADGGRPWDAFQNRIINPEATPQYLSTFADRSRRADYQRVKMPDFYLSRVLRHLGNPPEIDTSLPADRLAQKVEDYVSRLEPTAASAQTTKGLVDLERTVAAIQSRGGKVIIVSLPTSGLVHEADTRRFPKSLYWDRVAATTSAHAIHSQEHPELSRFACPDGSHLDQRDVPAFTTAFVRAAGLGLDRSP
ncbi:hypothetical protein EEB15_05555 [Ramlibacter sp. WS9]|nr:hypothetical protein EEB15_05555 [Ramlibacter sp. WS9]